MKVSVEFAFYIRFHQACYVLKESFRFIGFRRFVRFF